MSDQLHDGHSNSDVLAKQAQVLPTLTSVFGFSEFRGPQEAVIRSLVNGQSSLLLMPTGMGKSLCYQLPARILGDLTVVISPLIALMKDQVDAAMQKGLKATFINSSLSRDERDSRYRRLARGDFELLYVTPERFRIPEFLNAMAGRRVLMLAIDEAHCISQWGHDFRPDYSRVGEIRERLGRPVTLALTATATPDVQKDILLQLGLPSDTHVFNEGLLRPNLSLNVFDLHGHDQKIQSLIAERFHTPGAMIVYVSLVQTLRELSASLDKLGISHWTYHGQMDDRSRRRCQEQFLQSRDGLMLATPAFGLGVDKPDVRCVVHAEIPGSIESYYQEVGRAGRDGRPSRCVLLFDPDDVTIQMDFLKWSSPDPGFIRAVLQLIKNNNLRARQEGFDYLRTQMNFYNRRDFRVETAVNLLERWGCLAGRNPQAWDVLQDAPEEYLDVKAFDASMKAHQSKLLQMSQFASLDASAENASCRMLLIHQYFEQTKQVRASELNDVGCGACDVCLAKKSAAAGDV